MAIDIELCNSSNPIKNGTIVSTCTFTGYYDTINTYSTNTPTISDIESKYDDKFDDITYYILGYS